MYLVCMLTLGLHSFFISEPLASITLRFFALHIWISGTFAVTFSSYYMLTWFLHLLQMCIRYCFHFVYPIWYNLHSFPLLMMLSCLFEMRTFLCYFRIACDFISHLSLYFVHSRVRLACTKKNCR